MRNQPISQMQREFSWVLKNSLAGMPAPGATISIEKDLDFLRDKKIRTLFNLTERASDTALFADYGIELIHIPMADFSAPTEAQLKEFVRLTDMRRKEGLSVGVHCMGGKGRTGTFLAAYLVSTGMNYNDAIKEIRTLRPGSIETQAQAASLRQFQLMRAL